MNIPIPFYQTEWHGLSLVRIAQENRLPLDRVADHRFYQKLYETWQGDNFHPDPDWIKAKARLAEILQPHLQNPGLSLGVGLGIIEALLIQRGFALDLQECQAASLTYFRRMLAHSGHPLPRMFIAPTIEQIPSASYCTVLAISLSYVFNERDYRMWLAECRRIMKPGSRFILWEHDAFLPMGALRRLVRRAPAVRWGWVRTPEHHRHAITQAGFDFERSIYFNDRLEPITDPFRIFGMQLPRLGPSHAQCHFFRADSSRPAAG